MGSTAQFKSFGPFFHSGALVTAPRVYHYVTGTTTQKDAWTDRLKVTTAEHPIVGDANGMAYAYFDGLYKIEIRKSDDATVLFVWDEMDMSEAEHRIEGVTTWAPGSLSPGQGVTSPSFTVMGASLGDYVVVSAPYDLQGIFAEAFVSASNTVKIRVQYDLSMLRGAFFFNPASLVDAAGETSGICTVTGAIIGDAVVLYPPYDLEDLIVTGYVQSADSVEVRVQNESGGVVDLGGATWNVGVIPKGPPISLGNGSWKVRVFQQ